MWWIFGKSTEEDDTPFKHSVASFDPIATAVIIWTRVTLPSTGEAGESSEGINVMWEFSKSRDFTNVVQSGTYVTSAKRDYTVAVDVTGLEPATRYYYRFKTGNPMHLSKTGQTKTLPIGNVEEMILAHVSCANYGFGYFNVYDCLSRADNLDLVIHGGDYIYEYSKEYYPERYQLKRHGLRPKTECASLADFRLRHATAKRDLGLQRLHETVPMVCTWDDHEIADSVYIHGSEGFEGTKEEFIKRTYEAVQAYIEWCPVRGMPHQGFSLDGVHRFFQLGNLGTLMFIENRISNRMKPVDIKQTKFYVETAKKDPKDWNEAAILEGKKELLEELADPKRRLIGDFQLDNIRKAVKESVEKGHPWQILNSQTIFAEIFAPRLFETLYLQPKLLRKICGGALRMAMDANKAGEEAAELARMYTAMGKYHIQMNPDSWDGYQWEKDQMMEAFSIPGANPIVLAGDSHNAWAHEIITDHGKRVAVEFDSPAVTSIGFVEEIYAGFERKLGRLLKMWPIYLFTPWIVDALKAANPTTLKYCNLSDRGFLLIALTPRQFHCEFHFVDNVSKPKYKHFVDKAFMAEVGQPGKLHKAVRYMSFEGKIPHGKSKKRGAFIQAIHDISRGMGD